MDLLPLGRFLDRRSTTLLDKIHQATMMFKYLVVATVVASLTEAFAPPTPLSFRGGSEYVSCSFAVACSDPMFSPFAQTTNRLHSTAEKKKKDRQKKEEAPPVSIGWDSHQAVDSIPDSLVREADGGPDGNFPMRYKFEKLCREAQISITKAIEEIDGEATFQEDCWTRENGGGGMSRVLSGGKVFEKAGVNLSVVYGSMPQEALQAATERGVDRAKGMKPGERVPFFACGLSSVMHPRNPHCVRAGIECTCLRPSIQCFLTCFQPPLFRFVL